MSISLVSFSCGSDDDGDGGSTSGSGVLVYGDTEYQLKSGVIEDYGEYSNGIYNFDISLVDSGLRIVDGEAVPTNDVFSGVYFELFTSNSQDLAEGVYTFGNNIEGGAYSYAEIIIDATVDEDYDAFEINSGTFTVLDDGSSYEFEFEGTVSNGASFSGYYTGSLVSVDYSSDLGRSATSNATKTKALFN
ncbi:hypothetical protein [Winogradskyella thalassocola]|uniref:Uncharacterized protein n=1 Tax=Winogradskyella thalassocola TaxID=262004 RepID=A0A1G7W8L9_9FLAO|nr:hypothetical protein [Winogradskyella thalassocola]SDG68288.1 hypothetical protein SAMN04489796_101286 [Winogradskyella thalassocola]